MVSPAPITYLTFYFNLNKRDPTRTNKYERYPSNWNNVLQITYPMVIFTEEEYVTPFREGRGDRPTTIISMKFEELPYYKYKEIIGFCRQANPVFNSNPKKDTVDYTILILSRQYFLRRLYEENPYSSSYFAMIDIGITHVAHLPDGWEEINSTIQVRPNISVCCMRNTSKRELEDRVVFYSYFRGRICAGVITGPFAKIPELSSLFSQEFLRSLRVGVAPSDEQILSWLVVEHPSLFTLYYGDYCDILRNYARIQDNPGILLFNLYHTEEKEDGIKLYRAIEEAQRRNPGFLGEEEKRKLEIWKMKFN